MVSGTLQTLALNPPAGGIPTSRSRISPTCAHGATLFARRLPVRLQPPPRLREVPHRISPVVRAAGGAYQVSGGSGGELSGDAKGGKLLSWARPLVDFASSNFLPLALVSGVALGFLNPTPGCLAHKYSISKFSAFGIFVISGLTLRSEDIGAAAEAWPAGLFGLASILLFTPFLSRLILQLQLSPQEFVTGLAIFCCMPTTLSSGITLTQLVRGNSALALALTVLSNLLGILLVPFSLSNFIGQGAGVSIPTMQLLKSLIMTLLVPLILGKVFRDSFGGVAEFVDQNRKLFSMTSAVFLSLVPWIQVSRSRSLLLAVQPTVFLAAVVMGILLHLILLAFNALALHSLSAVSGKSSSVFAKKENARAVILVASQKTLPVMVAVVEQLGGALGQSGLLVLPCVAAHINQIIIDSLLINKWLRSDLPSPKLKEA
uniref:Probable sodium/metabolite cotransporter BASS4, chloroplastic n=1 Tax=Anthurium amnicola TaxID=1678845 RepID=A0A1D1ZJ19_9ARAE